MVPSFPDPAVFDQLTDCLTVLGRPSLFLQNNTHGERGLFLQKEKKDLVPQSFLQPSLFQMKDTKRGIEEAAR